MGAMRQRKRWVFSLGGTCLTTKCTLHRVSYSCTLACIYEISFFLVLTWHMNCSVSRLRRGTMLVLLVVPPPASSHITDSRSITRALQRTCYFCRTRNIRWIFELENAKNTFLKCLPSHLHSSCVDTLKPLHRAVAEPRVSSEQELRCQIWGRQICIFLSRQIQFWIWTNTSKNGAVKSERRSVREMNARSVVVHQICGMLCVDLFNGFVPTLRQLWVSRQYFSGRSRSISWRGLPIFLFPAFLRRC